MRVVIQRVDFANVVVSGKEAAAINMGLLVFCGFEQADTYDDLEWVAGKIKRMRIFDDAEGVMNVSVEDVSGEVLLVSQFTLHASTKKGNRPSYIRAMNLEVAEDFFVKFVQKMSDQLSVSVKAGVFGAHMEITMLNNGPVTIIVDSRNRE